MIAEGKIWRLDDEQTVRILVYTYSLLCDEFLLLRPYDCMMIFDAQVARSLYDCSVPSHGVDKGVAIEDEDGLVKFEVVLQRQVERIHKPLGRSSLIMITEGNVEVG